METEGADIVVDGGNSSTPNGPLHSECNIVDNGRKRLSGAARKRFRKLVTSAGVAVDEALDLCRKPWKQMPADKQRHKETLKRGRSEDKTLEEPINKAPKLIPDCRQNPKQNPRPFKRISEATRIGIRNSEPMSAEQMSQIHRHLILSIAKMDTASEGPEFLGFTQKAGWILVTCVNQRSHDWLVDEISNLKPWPEAQLTVVKEHELPRPTTVVTFVPKSEAESTAEAMTLLEVQNKGLKTGLWRVLNEKEEGTGRVVTFAIDELSVEALKARDYVATLGFRRVFFKIRKGQQAFEQKFPNDTHSTFEPTSLNSCRQTSEGSEIQGSRTSVFRDGSRDKRENTFASTMYPQNMNPNLRARYTPQTEGSGRQASEGPEIQSSRRSVFGGGSRHERGITFSSTMYPQNMMPNLRARYTPEMEGNGRQTSEGSKTQGSRTSIIPGESRHERGNNFGRTISPQNMNANPRARYTPQREESGRQTSEGSEIQGSRTSVFRGESRYERGNTFGRTMSPQNMNPNPRARYTPQTEGSGRQTSEGSEMQGSRTSVFRGESRYERGNTFGRTMSPQNMNPNPRARYTPQTEGSGRQTSEGSEIQGSRTSVFRGESRYERGNTFGRTMSPQNMNPNPRARYTPQIQESGRQTFEGSEIQGTRIRVFRGESRRGRGNTFARTMSSQNMNPNSRARYTPQTEGARVWLDQMVDLSGQ